MIMTSKNFDWSITKRKIVIFMPNWGRGDYIRKTVEAIETTVPLKDWLVIAMNDRIHEDLSDLDTFQNTVYCTFGSERTKEPRGDAFMRNIAIKNCQSEWFFQKDPEIIIEGDFIKHILECPTDMYRLSGPAKKVREATTLKFMDNQSTIEQCKNDCDQYEINEDQFVFFHFGFAVKTSILKAMRGYDEDYKKMYCADRDLYGRLMAQGVRPTFDPECHPLHLWHTEPWYPDTPEAKADYAEMKALFAGKKATDIVRNDPDLWGKGD